MRVKLLFLSFLLFLTTGLLKAQNIEYGILLDTTYMMIGDQQYLTFRVKIDAGIKVIFPQLKDTVVAGVEIISGPKRDSVKGSDGKWLYEEKYLITAFDSGMYVIPPMPFTVETGSYNNTLRTEQAAFVVNTYQIDDQKGNYDIVMPYAAPWTFAEILPYLLWGLGGLILVGLIWWYLDRRRRNKPLFVSKKEEIPPYVKAIKTLDEIKAQKLWQIGREKEYYTKLTDAVRLYLDEEFNVPAMEQTSAETIRAVECCKEVESRDRDHLAEMLQMADYVKFAKYTPLQDESARYLDAAYDFVNNSHQRLLQEMAEQQEKERLEKERIEKEKAEAERLAKKEMENK